MQRFPCVIGHSFNQATAKLASVLGRKYNCVTYLRGYLFFANAYKLSAFLLLRDEVARRAIAFCLLASQG